VARGSAIAIVVVIVTAIGGFVPDKSTGGYFAWFFGSFIWPPLFVAFGLLAKRLTLQLLRLRSTQINRNIIIGVLALFWIAINTAHAYTFFRGNASNPYVKCLTAGWREETDAERICGNGYSMHRDRLEQDRFGVTLKSALNATGMALVACFLIIGARKRASPK
jgi:hypothetical protein